MKRTDFSIESQIVGRDFEGLIEQYGGKGAGLELLREVQQELILYDYRVPQYKLLSTKISSKIGSTLKNNSEEVHSFLHSHKYYENLQKMESMIDNKSAFETAIYSFARKVRKMNVPFVHLRSSSTIEDWKDDSYYGTFLTNKASFGRQKISYKEVISKTKELFFDFFLKQLYGDYNINFDEQLGVVGMESSMGRYHVTAYSSYPEKNPHTSYIEISYRSKMEMTQFGDDEDHNPCQLIKISQEGIEIIPSQLENQTTPWYQKRNPFTVDGVRSAFHKDQLESLYFTLQRMQNLLEKPVNLELIVDIDSHGSHYNDIVQLRPVPVLDQNRKVTQLTEMNDNYFLLGKTPFVIGSFRVEAPLIKKRKESGHRPYYYSEETILIDDNESCKGHRSYIKDNKVVGLVSTKSGVAISHDYQITPNFLSREWFHQIGFHLESEKLKNQLVKTSWVDQDNHQHEASMTRFPIIIESDGREGQIFIRKEYLDIYNTPVPEDKQDTNTPRKSYRESLHEIHHKSPRPPTINSYPEPKQKKVKKPKIKSSGSDDDLPF